MKEFIYDKKYYDDYDNGRSYNNIYLQNFHHYLADIIKLHINPKTVLDVGCADGQFIHYLRQNDIEAYGVDISKYAIQNAYEDVKLYVENSKLPQLNIPNNFPNSYDLICCIEVLQHISKQHAQQSIKRLTQLSNYIFFSSTFEDFEDESHLNVQPMQYWRDLFYKYGFVQHPTIKFTWVIKQSMFFEKIK